MNALEERLAHLIRANDELSDEVARQAGRMARLEAQVRLLLDRERARAEAEGSAVIGDERPPHY